MKDPGSSENRRMDFLNLYFYYLLSVRWRLVTHVYKALYDFQINTELT